jgi:hypothetical protein
MRKTPRLYSVFFILLSVGVLSACQSKLPPTPKPLLDVGDGGFLSEQPCGPPCFWGIIPEITTKEQALDIIQGLLDINHCDEWPGIEDSRSIMCNPLGIQFSSNNEVDYISFLPGQAFALKEVIEKYGQPDAFKVLGWSEENSGVTTSVTMLLYFDDIRTVVGLSEQAGENYVVASSTLVGTINYRSLDRWNEAREDTQDWLGYGEYQGPYWGGP